MMNMNQVEPRTREERAALKDRERIEQLRLRERIGSYHKYVDNALVNNPDPTSSHFLPDNDRFNKDFASHDKMVREQQHKQKMEVIEKKRVEKYERDLKRWEFMDEESERQSKRIEQMNDKYLTGQRNKGGAAYNILNLQYEHTDEGQFLKQRDDDAKVRAMMRSKNLDVRSNCGFNPLNGSQRMSVNVPQHQLYNPNELQSVGASIMGTGFAGKPLRKEMFEPVRSQTQPAAMMRDPNYYDAGAYGGQMQQQNQQYPPQGQYQQNQGMQQAPSQQQFQQYQPQQNYQQQQMPPSQYQPQQQVQQQQPPQFGGFPTSNPNNFSASPSSGQLGQQANQMNNAASLLPINQQQQSLYGGQGHYLYNQPNIQRDSVIAPAYTQQQQANYNQQFVAGGAGTKFY
ncbi:UNKNOWN [Stylonychia lemnae]|uniref:Uncharacterized protein n=1 Tax=Stylonychia lemnae TaxID=5949 RepID=A0A078AT83_STYLE|nr:UNKNOWN [Stylonychia lemnae]|eukprot:CDW85399.1 UNKNOWN [Stylonychia lemnae]